MNIHSQQLHIRLPHRSTMALAEARGADLTCLAGTVWITQASRTEDWVLHPGQSLTVANDGTVFVTACQTDAELSSRPATVGGGPLRRALAGWWGCAA